MRAGKGEISFKKTVFILSIATFLTAAQVAGTTFAEDWPVWPKGGNQANEIAKPETPETAAAGIEGEEAGRTVAGGLSAGTIGFSAAMVAGAIAVGIATFSGGGNSTTHH
jgi:hypothetical protein